MNSAKLAAVLFPLNKQMKKLILVFMAILIGSNICICQKKQNKRTHAKEYLSLSGEVHILTLFVDTKDDYWEESEIEYYYDKLIDSQNWLIDQSYHYNKDLEFNNDFFFMDNQKVIYIPEVKRRGRGSSMILKDVWEELGYNNADDFIDLNNFDFENEKMKVLLFVKSKDRSHARNYWSVNSIDIAIVYCQNSFGMATSQYTISHEILHLFGAWDLYKGESQTLETAERAKTLYPNSIMINTWSNQKNLIIDELTAWRIGWTDYDEAYKYFDPHTNRKLSKEEKRKSKLKSIKFDLKNKD